MDEGLQQLEDEEDSSDRIISRDSALGKCRVLVTHAVGEVWQRFVARSGRWSSTPSKKLISHCQWMVRFIPAYVHIKQKKKPCSLGDLLSVDNAGFSPEHPLEVGDSTKLGKAEGSDEPLPDTLLRPRYEEPHPHGDTARAAIFRTDENDDIQLESDEEDVENDIQYVVQVFRAAAALASSQLLRRSLAGRGVGAHLCRYTLQT
jgi:hypothetical protein